ncbi:MAG: HAD family phosphatase [Coriobacteriaceae bacterium]|nr:HAD family phosphatase [Coriobacteriaceae bacterium]
MYRLIASDMDETFLDAEHRIPEVNIRAIRRAREHGVLFVPSSGRAYASIMHSIGAIDPALMEGSFVISFNGGFINRYGDPEPFASCGLTSAVAARLYEDGLRRGLCVLLNMPDGTVHIVDAPESERRYVRAYRGIELKDSASHRTFESLRLPTAPVKVCYMSDDFEGLKRLGERLAPAFFELGVEPTFSSGRYMELMPAGINKGAGLLRLAEILGIAPEQTIAVGDSANDLAMIEAAGLGVGVANVTDDVRPFCDAVLRASADDGAIAEVVERFILAS